MKFDNLRGKIMRANANSLANEGLKLIEKAFNESTYRKDKTQNLHDSHGCCVYYNGIKVDGTERYLVPRAVEPRYNADKNELQYGKDEIRKFFNEYKSNYKGYELVMAAAMFYGRELEEGSSTVKRKYKVITFILDDAKEIASKYNGSAKLLGK